MGGTLSAANFTTAVQQPAGQNWEQGIWDPGATVPAAGNTYQVVAGGNPSRVRNPVLAAGQVATFPGDSLTLDAATEIRWKGPGTIMNVPGVGGAPGLILNGGNLDVGDEFVVPIRGRVHVLTNSSLSDGNSATRAMSFSAALSGSGNLTLNGLAAGNSTPVDFQNVSNTFSGEWIVNNWYLKGSGTNSLGTNSITLNGNNSKLEVNYNMTSFGTVTLNGTNKMLLHSFCQFRSLVVNGTVVPNGIYSFAQLNAAYPTNFPGPGSGGIRVGPPAIVQDLGAPYIAWEAENMVTIVNGTTATWGIIADPLASGGFALAEGGVPAPNNDLVSTSSWTIVFQTAGTYQMYIKYQLSPCCGANSYRFPETFGANPTFRVSRANENGAGPTTYTVIREREQNTGLFGTFTVAPSDVNVPLTFAIGNRETPGLTIDRIVLSTNPNLDVGGNGAFDALLNSSGGTQLYPNPGPIIVDSRLNPNGVRVTFGAPMNTSVLNTANYTLSGETVTGAAFVGSGSNVVQLTVSPALTLGTSYTLTVSGVSNLDGTVISPNPTTTNFVHGAGLNQPIGLAVSIYNGANSLPLLKSAIANCAVPTFYADTTNVAMEYTTSERGTVAEGNTFLRPNTENYGTWIRGVFVPPTSGNYQFALSSDDISELYLSTDSSPANKVLLTSQGAWNGYRGFISGNGNGAPPLPAPVSLVAGRSYYLEVLVQEGGGGDHVSVAVRKPGDGPIADNMLPIPRSMFATNYSFGCPPIGYFNSLGPIAITDQPSNQSANERFSATFFVGLDGSPPYSVQWYSNNVAIPGATRQAYTFQTIRYANNAQYFAVVQNEFSSATSSVATLTVVSDTTPPTMLSAASSATFTNLTIAFSEPVNTTSGINVANYTITNSAGAPLAVLSASVRDNTNVILRTALQATGERYTVVVNNVGDRAGVPNPVVANSTISFRAWVFTPGYALMEVFPTGGGTTIPLLINHPSYPNYPSERYYLTSSDSRLAYPNDSHDNYGGRISGLFIPPTNGNYVFKIARDDDARLNVSTNENPASAQTLISVACCDAAFTAASAPVTLLGGGPRYYYELLWKEGGGGDYARLSIDGLNTIPTDFLGIYANPDAANLVITAVPQNTTNEVGHLATFTITGTANPGFPLTYQWYSNGVAIAGARANTYSTGPLALADDNTVYTVVTIVPGAVQTNSAVSRVVADVTPPTLIGAFGFTTLNQVEVTWSEFMDLGTLGEGGNYTITNMLGEDLPISIAVATGPNTALLTTAAQVPGARYVVFANTDVRDTQNNPATVAGNSAAFNAFAFAGQVNGSIFRELYDGIGGVNLPDLTNNAAFIANNPTSTDMLTTFNSPDRADNYGVRITGYIIPTETANYTFRLQSDDQGAVYLSTDEKRANASFLAGMDLGQCCVDKFSGTRSLVAGRPYYVEALMKEGGGGDYIRLAWVNNKSIAAYVNIPTENLAYFYSLSITQQPANVTVNPNVTPGGGATFTVGAQPGGAAIAAKYQWERSDDGGSTFVTISGATGRSYTRNTAFGDNGAQFRAVVSLLGGFQTNVSSAATLTLTADTTKPVVTRVSGTRAGNEVKITFNEAMATGSAEEEFNYTLTRAGGGTLTVSNAILGADLRSVILTVPNLGIGSNYTINIANVSDLGSGNIITTTNVSFQSWIIGRGSLLFDTYLGLSLNPVIEDLTNAVSFPNNPSETTHITSTDSRQFYPNDSHEGYGGRMTGYLVPPLTANYDFYIKSDDASKLFLSTNSQESNKVQLAFEPGCCTPYSAHGTNNIALVAGQQYYIEVIYKEGTGGDFVQVAAKLSSDSSNPDNLSTINGAYLASLADPVGASITFTQQPIGTTVVATASATLRVGVTTTNDYGDFNRIVYQWQRLNGATWEDVLGANSATYTTTPLGAGENRQYRAVVYIPGANATSAAVTVSAGGQLRISRSGTTTTLSWAGPGTLYESGSVNGPFTVSGNQANPQVVPTTGTMKFFQLR